MVKSSLCKETAWVFLHISVIIDLQLYAYPSQKNQVKQTNSELVIISGGLTKELQPLHIGDNRAFKVKLLLTVIVNELNKV